MARIHRTLSVVGATALGMTLLAGCGQNGTITISSKGGAETTAPGAHLPEAATATLASLRSAGQATKAVTSARYETVVADGEGQVFMTATGEVSGERTHQKATVSGPGMSGGKYADLTSEVVTDGPSIYLGGSMFTRIMGMLGETTPKGDAAQWVKLVLPGGTDTASELGVGSDVLGTQTAQLLEGAYGEVTKVGSEEVRGLPTIRYRVDVDPSKVGESIGAIGSIVGTSTLPTDVWVGDDGLVHRMRMELNPASFGVEEVVGEKTSTVVMTFEMWDVGADITVDVPQNAQSFDLSTLFGGGH